MIELAGKKKKNTTKKISDPCLYSKAGINQYDTYRGHHGMVTGIDFHPLHGPVDFSDLFLTSSVDWTVKLWRAKVNIPPLFFLC
jgi:WD40 repeat protein